MPKAKKKDTPVVKKGSLVIVESPTKARTISQILGKDFSVVSSYGHLIDLPKKELGVDIEKGFSPVSYTHLTLPTKRIV